MNHILAGKDCDKKLIYYGSLVKFIDDGGSYNFRIEGPQKQTENQTGPGFKTSIMKLGADAIVFTRSACGSSSTQSIGLFSYTFLKKLFHYGRKLKQILNRVNGGCVISFKMDRCWLDIQFGNYVSGLELVAAYADDHVKIYESLDTLELKR